jgi:hypothetical protein
LSADDLPARLYMGVLGRPAAAFAADSARRRQAKDSATSDALTNLQLFLNQALSPKTRARLKAYSPS